MQFDCGRAVSFASSSMRTRPIASPTEIYVPRVQFPNGFETRLEGGTAEIHSDPLRKS